VDPASLEVSLKKRPIRQQPEEEVEVVVVVVVVFLSRHKVRISEAVEAQVCY